jgi:hypothetical protein
MDVGRDLRKMFAEHVRGANIFLFNPNNLHTTIRRAVIPCFPANNNTDAHTCDMISNCSSTPHTTEDSLFILLLPKSEPGQLLYSTTKQLNHCYLMRNRNIFIFVIFFYLIARIVDLRRTYQR